VSTKPKPTRRPTKTARRTSELFRTFGCKEVAYTLQVPVQAFDLKAFYKETGIPPKPARWSAILRAKNKSAGYHIHFNGKVESNAVGLYLKYYDGSIEPDPEESEPFAESMMPWLGKFFRESSWRASVTVRFEKPTQQWRSRFNLPFKVTMADSEVVIDGVSLALPSNPFGAIGGWLAKTEKTLVASAFLVRAITFATFSLGEDIEQFNEAIKIYVEEVKL
jgi:hypothetical protein